MGFLIAGIVAIALFALYLFLVFPKRPSDEQRRSLEARLFAHRGYYSNEPGGFCENSLAAIVRAADLGFGSELDVQLTRDNELVVFHDDELLRAFGDARRVDQIDYAELKVMRQFDTDTPVALFCEVLAAVGGRAPLIVEVKSAGFQKNARNDETCRATYELLKGYDGEYSVESFDPRVVAWFKKNAPEVMRGQLAEASKHFTGARRLFARAMAGLLGNFLSRPHYIAYHVEDQGFSFKLARVLGAAAVCWTCRDELQCKELLSDGQAVIFEGFLPKN